MKNITKQYQDLLEGKMSQHNFMTNVRREFPNWISSTNSFKDAISILKGKRVITEVAAPIVNPSAENPDLRGYDHVSYPELMRGMRLELAKAEVVSDESMVKAKETALKNLEKDPNFYRELFVANYKDIKKKDETLKMTPVKEDNKVDKPNELKVVKKDAAANTESTLSKKEAKKKKDGEGIQQMKGSSKKISGVQAMKIAALKEHIMDGMTQHNPNHENFTKGQRVKKKDGSMVGTIVDEDRNYPNGWDGHTAVVRTDDNELIHLQGNVITGKEVPDKGASVKTDVPNSVFNRNAGNKSQDWLSKLKEIKERLMKAMNKEIEEDLFTKGTGAVTADTVASKRALVQRGYRPVPNSGDIKSV